MSEASKHLELMQAKDEHLKKIALFAENGTDKDDARIAARPAILTVTDDAGDYSHPFHT